MRVEIKLPSVSALIRAKGLDKAGRVQMFVTMEVNRRIGKYMPHLTGVLETKLKHIRSSTEIEILGPYAKYQYYGKVMVNSKSGKGPALIPGVGYRYPRGSVLQVTNRPLQYTTTFNPRAGPYWDRAMIAAEGKALIEDIQRFIENGG